MYSLCIFGLLLLLSDQVGCRPVEEEGDDEQLLGNLKRKLDEFETELEQLQKTRLSPDSEQDWLQKVLKDRSVLTQRSEKNEDSSSEQDWLQKVLKDRSVLTQRSEKNDDSSVREKSNVVGTQESRGLLEWERTLNLMDRSKTLPNYNPLIHCSSEAVARMKFISKGCSVGACADPPSCNICYGCSEPSYRSLDGGCNDKNNVFAGSTMSPFERNIPIAALNYDMPIDQPNIRLISQKLMKRDTFKPHRTLGLLGVAYFQFFFQDLIHRSLDPSRIFNITIPVGDPLFGNLNEVQIQGTKFFDFGGCPFNFSQDQATAWVDGSQLYGSNAKTNTLLRTTMQGKIRLDKNQRLEFSNRMAVTGHPGGFWVGDYSLHTLFIREHNAICDMLVDRYPDWKDDKIFNTARHINSAQMLKAFIGHLLPALQSGPQTHAIAKWLWNGVTQEDILAHDPDTEDVVRTVYPPVLGSAVQDIEKLQATSEDMALTNRIHTFVPETLDVYDHNAMNNVTLAPINPQLASYSAQAVTLEFTENLKNQHTDEDLLYSMGRQRAGSVSLNNYPTSYMRSTVVVDTASSPLWTEIGFDMSLADLLRDRERGTPRYCQYLRLMGKLPPVSFAGFANDMNLSNRLSAIYGDIENLDLIVGLHVAAQVKNYGDIPPLSYELLISHLYRKITNDRFYTTDFNAQTYTAEGLFWIKKNNLNSIICRHYSSLCGAMAVLKNPLAVWDIDSAQSLGVSVDFV